MMYCFAALCRRFTWVPGAVMSWLLLVGTALAAEEEKAPAKSNWVMAYILVLLAIGLGLMVVLRPGRRDRDTDE